MGAGSGVADGGVHRALLVAYAALEGALKGVQAEAIVCPAWEGGHMDHDMCALLAGRIAAARGGMKTVLIPEENAKDLVEISDSIKKGLDIVPVSRMDEVLARALVRKPEAIEWDEEKAKPTETSVTTEPAVESDSSILTAH